jgi:aldehyde dehydrogenase (NAD+)
VTASARATAEPTARRDLSRPIAEAQRIFALQRRNRWVVAQTTAAERVTKLRALRDAIGRRRNEIAGAIQSDFGKHPTETELTEIQLTLTELKDAISNVRQWMRPRRVGTPLHMFGVRSEIRYEAKGVTLIMAAWNYPFALIVAPLIAAIAAGNCAILRPSEKVPHTNRVLSSIIQDVFHESEVAVVEGDLTTADALLALPFDHIFFTGSTRIGRRVMAAAAQTLASVTLELGGKCPAIVDETADVALAGERIAWGKFISAGQACVAPDYVLVHESKATGFIDAAKGALARFYGDSEDARATSPDLARVIDAASVNRLAQLVEDAVRRGATVECGGRWDAATRYVAPTILSNVAADAEIMADEIFGPVLPVSTYRTAADAYAMIRSRGKPLAMYVFSQSDANVAAMLANTSAGGTLVNDTLIHLANPNLPFGGTGESGSGSYHGEFGFRAFSHERSVVRRGPISFMRMTYPPYGAGVERIIKFLDRLRS